MEFKLEKVENKEKEILKNLLEFYLYDFNFYYEDDLNSNGRFDFIDVEPYFQDNGNIALFIKVEQNYAGFVLISNKKENKCIEEFWIMPKYRKGLFAFQVLKEILKGINGKIEFIIINQNKRWLKTLNYLINKNYKIISTENIKKWEIYDFTKFIVDCSEKYKYDCNKKVFKPSTSEENGVKLVKNTYKNILSVGISTAGSAEIEMAKKAPNSHIIATTIDNDGLEFSRKIIEEKGLGEQIELKLEDVSEKMPYCDNKFDYIYARLVLHYLENKQLEQALKEIKRVLKPNGLFYIVVRSRNEWEAKLEGATYDEVTGITKYPVYSTLGTNNVKYLYRRLHTMESLQDFLKKEDFEIKYIKEYQEECYKDYKRTEKVEFPNTIIECLVQK